MSETTPRPAPVTDDPDTGGFFQAAARGELALRYCRACDHVVHLPSPVCARCHSFDGEWRAVRARGVIYSFTICQRAVHPAFPAPYAVLLVDLDDAPEARLVGHVPGEPALAIGDPVEGFFEDVDGAAVLRWRPA
jgi:uncharacterized OB-fold protein